MLAEIHVTIAPAFVRAPDLSWIGTDLREVATTWMWEQIVVFLRVHLDGKRETLEIALAGGGLGLILCLFQGGHQDRHENGNDGDHDEEFDQCEGTRSSHESCSFSDRIA